MPFVPHWPDADDLAAELGLLPGDDPDNVALAAEAAHDDALRHRPDLAPDGPQTANVYKAVLGLGTWWYQNRNRAPDPAYGGAVLTTAPSRRTLIDIITGQMVVG